LPGVGLGILELFRPGMKAGYREPDTHTHRSEKLESIRERILREVGIRQSDRGL
jgi:hypothetical protein